MLGNCFPGEGCCKIRWPDRMAGKWGLRMVSLSRSDAASMVFPSESAAGVSYGVSIDYTEQTSWLLFLKYRDALETDRATVAALNGKTYTHRRR